MATSVTQEQVRRGRRWEGLREGNIGRGMMGKGGEDRGRKGERGVVVCVANPQAAKIRAFVVASEPLPPKEWH